MRRIRLSLTMSFLLLSLGNASALCINGRISLKEEMRDSSLIATAVVVGYSDLSDPDDPVGISGTRYDFKTTKSYKGKAKTFSVRVDNTSSAIVFEMNKQYLVFVQRSIDDGFVDGCGNSQLAAHSAKTVAWLKRVASHK